MATGMADCVDAPKTIGRGVSETRLPNVALGSVETFGCHTNLRRDSTVEASKSGAPPGEAAT
jgi:hypothetical protein